MIPVFPGTNCEYDTARAFERAGAKANIVVIRNKTSEQIDLFQAGCMGLVKATDAFDTQRGVRFSTYAVPVILGEIRRLFRDGGTVKVSRSLKELSMKVVREREKFAKETGREPTVGELSQRLGVEEEAVVEALGASAPVVSLTSDEDSSEIDQQCPAADERYRPVQL